MSMPIIQDIFCLRRVSLGQELESGWVPIAKGAKNLENI